MNTPIVTPALRPLDLTAAKSAKYLALSDAWADADSDARDFGGSWAPVARAALAVADFWGALYEVGGVVNDDAADAASAWLDTAADANRRSAAANRTRGAL